MTRPRCPRGHFLSAADQDCRCTLPRTRRLDADLWGQGRRIAVRRLATVRIVGDYL